MNDASPRPGAGITIAGRFCWISERAMSELRARPEAATEHVPRAVRVESVCARQPGVTDP